MPPSATEEDNGEASATQLPQLDLQGLLQGLNPAQRLAVTHDPSIPLQILAGPGSGKTKVLTSRIAYLILVHDVAPASICAVTFTNKAANEMRSRLIRLIGLKRTTALQMGTFHSICVRYLRMYSSAVGLDDNFTICDADESKKLVLALLKPYTEYVKKNDITVTESHVAYAISRAKAKGQSAAEYLKEVEEKERSKQRFMKPGDPQKDLKNMEKIIAEVYIGYELVLQNNNALDFDDLLVYGVRLFSSHQQAALWCRHILVDEFQDTNIIQYELMKCIAIRGRVTIVGDPDQSIYGWRSAQVENLEKMREDFPGTEEIILKQNYRSTGSIVRSSMAIVAEDKKRIPKSLTTSHPLGSTPFLAVFEDEKKESDFIAKEIKRCTANMGGVIKWGDFAILLRFNALSRSIESALQKQGIPCKILGGHKFFERMEVKDILAYLQLVDNPQFNPAFIRAVKVPPRGAGEKSLEEIASQAEKAKISQLTLVEKIVDNTMSDIKPSVKKKLAPFVKIIRSLRSLNEEETLPSEMIRQLVELINYEAHLKKTQQDWESRWENVQELITFASEIESDVATKAQHRLQHGVDELEAESEPPPEKCTLRHFLQSSMLSSEGDNDTKEKSNEKVTISTCHAAKGLEWPIVIIPSVDTATFPFYRSEDIDEERRLLYVACTRAQCLLYILCSEKRQVAGKAMVKGLSEFITVPSQKTPGLFDSNAPRFLPSDRAVICGVINRDLPDEAEIERRLKELELSRDSVNPMYRTSMNGMATVDLTGIKSAVHTVPTRAVNENLAALYPAPDALTSISASFLKDYNPRIPFSKQARLPTRATPSPFMPVTVELQTASLDLNARRLHAVKPVRSSEAQPSTSSSSSNVFTNSPLNPVPLAQNHKSSQRISHDGQLRLFDPRGKGMATRPSAPISVAATQAPPESLTLPRLREPKPAVEATAKPSRSDSSSFTRELQSSQMLNVPMAESQSQTRSTNSNNSSPVTVDQTIGAKRRLGMGRCTNGYSNKKFKSHI